MSNKRILMNIIYSNKYCYINSNGSLFVVMGKYGRLMITRDFGKAVACCEGSL